MPDLPYQYIAIEGNIGAGKTSLAKLLAEELGGRIVLEQFEENPFLPMFYENPARTAFPLELFFMTDRYKQLQQHFSRPELFSNLTFADFSFVKSLIFSRQNLNDEEYRIFQQLYQVLQQNLPKPDLMLYVHRPIEDLMDHIDRRGRSFEKGLTEDYLIKITRAYYEYFKTEESIPILLLNAAEIDFVERPENLKLIQELIQEPYKSGINHVSYVG